MNLNFIQEYNMVMCLYGYFNDNKTKYQIKL